MFARSHQVLRELWFKQAYMCQGCIWFSHAQSLWDDCCKVNLSLVALEGIKAKNGLSFKQLMPLTLMFRGTAAALFYPHHLWQAYHWQRIETIAIDACLFNRCGYELSSYNSMYCTHLTLAQCTQSILEWSRWLHRLFKSHTVAACIRKASNSRSICTNQQRKSREGTKSSVHELESDPHVLDLSLRFTTLQIIWDSRHHWKLTFHRDFNASSRALAASSSDTGAGAETWLVLFSESTEPVTLLGLFFSSKSASPEFESAADRLSWSVPWLPSSGIEFPGLSTLRLDSVGTWVFASGSNWARLLAGSSSCCVFDFVSVSCTDTSVTTDPAFKDWGTSGVFSRLDSSSFCLPICDVELSALSAASLSVSLRSSVAFWERKLFPSLECVTVLGDVAVTLTETVFIMGTPAEMSNPENSLSAVATVSPFCEGMDLMLDASIPSPARLEPLSEL